MEQKIIYGSIFVLYFLMMFFIGFHFYRKNKDISDYVLGGRNLNKWVAAMSAQASDMSGWLLMGLPGSAFLLYEGTNSAMWTAIGLAAGTYLNWLIVAKRLRKYTQVANNSITLPDYFENRFHDKTHILRACSAIFIAIFFLIYTASQFAAGAKLFQSVFGMDYLPALIIGAAVIVAYTFLGGFLAVCWTDLIQGILMFCALIVVPVVGVITCGGIDQTIQTANQMAAAEADAVGKVFSFLPKTASGGIGWMALISAIVWGVGYFGQPHILTRFMAIRHSDEIRPARIIAMVWVIISLFCAVIIGVIGKVYLTQKGIILTGGAAETVFMEIVKVMFNPYITGVLLIAILAAIMSTADSQLLVTSSAVANDLYGSIIKRDASPKSLMNVSRISVLVISVIAVFLAADPDSSVFQLVSYAWAGFGSAFGPLVLISLFWRRMTWQGALAGMVSGGLTALIWQMLKGGIFDLYELCPGFIISCVFIFAVSLLTKPNPEVQEEFDKVATSEF